MPTARGSAALMAVAAGPVGLKTGGVLAVEVLGVPPPEMEGNGNPEAEVAETPASGCHAAWL